MKISKYKDKNGKTKYRFYAYIGTDILTGKRKRTNRSGFNTVTEARKAYIDLIDNEIISDKTTFNQVYNKWFEIYKLTVKESTIKTTSDMFRIHILPEFGRAKIDEIGYDEVQTFTIKKSKEYKKYKEIVSYLSLIFKHSIRMGIRKDNPCDLVIYPKDTSKPYKSPTWSAENIKDFLFYAKKDLNQMWYLYFYLMIITGARRGEILALHWSDIDGDVITINRTTTRGINGQIVDTPKTKKSNRQIVINDEAVRLLKEYKKEQAKILGFQDIVFAKLRGGYINQTTPIKRLNEVVKKHNLPRMTLHGLRHTRATLLDQQGTRGKLISDILGHTNSKMTNRYTHSYIEEQREILKNFNSWSHGSHTEFFRHKENG